MPHLRDVYEAKEYLIGRILAEARAEGVELSEIERKMLAYSADDEQLFAALNEEFGRDYDLAEYEEKIGLLVRNLRRNKNEDRQAWDEAVGVLAEGDHYLLVLMEPPKRSGTQKRPPYDFLKLVLTAFALIIVAFLLLTILASLRK